MVGLVATERERARCRERLDALSVSALDSESLRREVIAELQRVIGFDRWCWPLGDPETLLPLDGIAEHDFGRGVPRFLELEYSRDDFAAKHVLACRANPAASLSAETSSDLPRSPRWDEVMRPAGIGDVAAVACRDAAGCWGWVEAYRDGTDRRFDEQDLDLLAQIGPSLGAALRHRAMGETTSSGNVVEPRPPGMMVLDHDLKLISWTAGARAWIDAMPAARLYAAFKMLPAMIYPAAARARSRNDATGAHALVRAADGGWMMVEVAPLHGQRHGEIAVNIRAATTTEIFALMCRAYALSRRERQVVELLAAGLDTRAVTQRLFISRHTVQDHLKSIFEKIGIHSRRELLAKLGASEAGSS